MAPDLWMSIPLGIGTYIGGLLTKPVQNVFQERREGKQLHRALYVEMSSLTSHYVFTISELRRDQSIGNHLDIYIKKLWPCPCFEHAKTKPVTLNLLKDIAGIDSFYGGLEALSNSFRTTQEDHKPQIWFASVFIETALAIRHIIANRLDKKLLMKCSDERTSRFIQFGIENPQALIGVFNSRSQLPRSPTGQQQP